MPTQPHWMIVATIGAIIGLILPWLLKLIYFGLRRFSKHHLEGIWFGYYFINENNQSKIGKEILKISKGIKHPLKLKGKSLNQAISVQQKYRGIVSEERNFLIIQMHPTKHKENIFIRVKSPIPGNDELLLGLWSAIDFDGNASVGPMIASRNELDNGELKSLLSRISYDPEAKFLKVL